MAGPATTVHIPPRQLALTLEHAESFAREDFLTTDHKLGIPVIVIPHIHEFDEAERNSCLLKMKRHRDDFGIVYPALDDHIDLHTQPRPSRGIDAFEDLVFVIKKVADDDHDAAPTDLPRHVVQDGGDVRLARRLERGERGERDHHETTEGTLNRHR